MSFSIKVGARDSQLSRAQVDEVLLALQQQHPAVTFDPLWIKTVGDRDLITSLRSMDKTDFFTRDIDQLQLQGACRISIHSAKDLPQPLAQGLVMVALTQGVDPKDVLVFREHQDLSSLPQGARVATSSIRREAHVRALREDLVCIDVRGSVPSRLAQLDAGEFDALVVAEAALIRLLLTHRARALLPGPPAPFQGQLAILSREGDEEMRALFSSLDSRKL